MTELERRSTQLGGLLRHLAEKTSPEEVAELAIDHVRTVTGARWAEVVQGDPRTGALTTVATADPGLTAELQRCRAESGEPPTPGAAELAPVIVLDDMRTSSPWPDFAALATATTPVRSAVLTYVTSHQTATVVPVYDDRPGYFTPERQQYVQLVAQVTGLALTRLAVLDVAGQLRVAAASRQQIGVAIGILCATRGLTPDAAFDLLRDTSSHTNRKLRLVAADVVRDGELRL